MLSNSPRCKRRSRYPAVRRAAADSGGVLISPCNHTSGLSVAPTGKVYVIYDISTSRGGAPPNHACGRRPHRHSTATCTAFLLRSTLDSVTAPNSSGRVWAAALEGVKTMFLLALNNLSVPASARRFENHHAFVARIEPSTIRPRQVSMQLR